MERVVVMPHGVPNTCCAEPRYIRLQVPSTVLFRIDPNPTYIAVPVPDAHDDSGSAYDPKMYMMIVVWDIRHRAWKVGYRE